MPSEPVTRAYADAKRKDAYGNTVERCSKCGFEAWGRPASIHGMYCDGSMVNLDKLVIDPKPPVVRRQYKR